VEVKESENRQTSFQLADRSPACAADRSSLGGERDAGALSDAPENSLELCFPIPLEIHMTTVVDDRATVRLFTEQRRRGVLSAFAACWPRPSVVFVRGFETSIGAGFPSKNLDGDSDYFNGEVLWRGGS
jgi:hypothetical protein